MRGWIDGKTGIRRELQETGTNNRNKGTVL